MAEDLMARLQQSLGLPQLRSEPCRDCKGTGIDLLDYPQGREPLPCPTCWGAGELEVQRGR